MKISVDFRLLDVSLELHALEDHLEIIENHIMQLTESEFTKFNDFVRAENLTPDDADWDLARQERDHRIEFLFPRFFRGPFLVALYAVFEAAVIEISRLIQSKNNQQISINDLRGDFLEKAIKYYKNILQFDLYANKEWEQINMLSELRNAIAHTNGRIDMLKKESQKKILKWEKQNDGISTYYNFLVVDAEYTRKIYDCVRVYLEDLLMRYKEWDTNHA
jgi:hypothetical protein